MATKSERQIRVRAKKLLQLNVDLRGRTIAELADHIGDLTIPELALLMRCADAEDWIADMSEAYRLSEPDEEADRRRPGRHGPSREPGFGTRGDR